MVRLPAAYTRRMAHTQDVHTWGPVYELDGTSYRECTDADCHAHQEWICVLDRWSDAFDTLSPRARLASGDDDAPEPAGRR